MELLENHHTFLARCTEARTYALSLDNPLIVHHYDADGIASGSIVMAAFLKEKKPFRSVCIKKLDDFIIDQLKAQNERNIIFVDLGSGNKRVNEFENVVIIDHHQPLSDISVKQHVNCMLFGIDGGEELSAASTVYLVFRERIDLAITGAVADQQAPLHGFNRYILEEGVAKGEVTIENDLCFYGRYARPLLQFLSLSDDPYIPGISYHEDRALQLLTDLNIPLKDGEKWRVYADLDETEKKKLVNALVDILVSSGSHRKAAHLIGESYTFPKHPKDETYEASEFSTLLNACGRHNAHEIAVGVCLNNSEAFQKSKQLLLHHKQLIRQGIEYSFVNRQDFGKFYFLDGRGVIDEGIIGIICGITLQYNATKPMLGVSRGDHNTIKFSARGTKSLIANGLNLGEIMIRTSKEVGGIGGGHKIAAGASIPEDKLNEFLLAVGASLRPLS